MNTLGIRVEPKGVNFAIYSNDACELVTVELLKIPKAMPRPESLKYVRNSILDILREFEISHAGIRVTESSARTKSIERIEIEGVIQEAFASSMLTSYFCGQISTIASKLNIQRSEFKEYINERSFDRIENWDEHTSSEKEAILTAIGATNA